MRDVLLAAIIGAHGLKGEVRVKTFTETPQSLTRYGVLHDRDGREFRITAARATKNGEAVIVLDGVRGRAEAEELKGTELFVARAALPAPAIDEFYHADLIGLRAEDESGRVLGTVRAIHNFGAGDVIEIVRDDNDTVFLPFTRETVPQVDVKGARLIVAVPEEVETGEKGNVE
jgi:16S rRNA processing protein RimM